jgi:hypothetical protein
METERWRRRDGDWEVEMEKERWRLRDGDGERRTVALPTGEVELLEGLGGGEGGVTGEVLELQH